MLLFCPSCSNVLTVSSSPSNPNSNSFDASPSNRLECRTCPYQYILTKRYYERKPFERKAREDAVGANTGGGGTLTQKQCDDSACEGMEARFYQVQIRSADEPMTTFYECMTCKKKWREN